MNSTAKLYAFFLRTGNLFDEVISYSTEESWKNRVREEAQMPNADVLLIQPQEWLYPKLPSATPDILRDAWPQIKNDIQRVFLSRGFTLLQVEAITQRPVAITLNPLSGLVTFIFADVG